MKEKQGHWYVVRMPLYKIKNIERLCEINSKIFENRIELLRVCKNLGIRDMFGMCPSIDIEKLDSLDSPSKGSVTFTGGHAEIRVFLSFE